MLKRIIKHTVYISIFLLFIPIVSFGLEIDRDVLFAENPFLQLKPNGGSIAEIENSIKPNIDLKGASVEEEKELLSAFYLLGYRYYLILYCYVTFPLDLKIGDSTTKQTIVTNLKSLRDVMAQIESDDRMLELITQIIERIENENIKSTKPDSTTLALFDKLNERLYEHINNTFGASYQIYYEFGIWTNRVMTYSTRIEILNEKSKNKNETNNRLNILTQELKDLLDRAETYKTKTEALTVKAVGRNLDSIYEVASEIKSSIDTKTAKRLYDYSLNIYYGIVPGN